MFLLKKSIYFTCIHLIIFRNDKDCFVYNYTGVALLRRFMLQKKGVALLRRANF